MDVSLSGAAVQSMEASPSLSVSILVVAIESQPRPPIWFRWLYRLVDRLIGVRPVVRLNVMPILNGYAVHTPDVCVEPGNRLVRTMPVPFVTSDIHAVKAYELGQRAGRLQVLAGCFGAGGRQMVKAVPSP